MVGSVHFHKLPHVCHDNAHAGQSLLDDGASGTVTVPIPYPHGLDAGADAVVGRLLEELERDAGVGVWQREDHGVDEQGPQPREEGIRPLLDRGRVGIPFIARRNPRVVFSAQISQEAAQDETRAVLAAKLLQVHSREYAPLAIG